MFELYPGYNATPMTELAMQLPAETYGVPFSMDWNSDGWLDLWHYNHYKFSGERTRWSDPSTETLGPKNGCMADWDAVLQHGDDGTFYAPNGGDGFIEWADRNTDKKCFDPHSTSIIDIDGDGVKDLFMITGGGHGVGNSWVYDNALFWGVPENSQLGFRLVGGRDAALAAGLEGRSKFGNERGRHMFWFDANGDGRLDVILFNNERKDDIAMPGFLYRNANGRNFRKVRPGRVGFAEFATMALLTDMDGDGFARELVVPSECNYRSGPSDPTQNSVCKRSPKGSISIYRFDSSERLLVRESTKPPFQKFSIVKSLGTGDFDFDGLADIAILWETKVDIYLSSARQQRCNGIIDDNKRRKCLLTLGQPNVELALTSCGKEGAVNFRFADFNLDGRIDMLVVCRSPGAHVIYELNTDGKWRHIKEPKGATMTLGEMNSRTSMMGGSDFCEGVPVAKKLKDANRRCKDVYSRTMCRSLRYEAQFLVCNMRALTPGVRAIGATVGDLDNDGFVDVIMGYKFGANVILRNTSRKLGRKRFLAVRLDRTAGAAASIGAIVTVTASRMGPFKNETTTQLRVISTLNQQPDANGGHEDRLIFGLGRRGRVTKLVVQWPHCCEETVIFSKDGKFGNYYNSMMTPYDVPAPNNCDSSCLTKS